jgi:hypothetical protein
MLEELTENAENKNTEIDGVSLLTQSKGYSPFPVITGKNATQFEKAKEIKNTWVFEEKEYPLLVINGIYNVGIPIYHPVTKKHVANLVADLSTDDTEAFFDHMDMDFKRIYNSKEDITTSEQDNLNKKNDDLFKATCQGGLLIKLDEDGDEKSREVKSAQQMNAMPREYKSQLILDWLNHFYIERYFPEGEGDAIDAILNPPETIYFKCGIGEMKNPVHTLIFEFSAPNQDQRSALETKAVTTHYRDTSEGRTTFIEIDYPAKYRFGRLNFKSVQGVSIEEPGNPYNGSDKHKIAFREKFNPHFWIRLADSLMDAFSYQKK